MILFNFEVETIESGQRHSYGDSFYAYKITTNRPENEVRNFCMNVLRKSYETKDMPNPFSGKLIEFKKLTDNNKGKNFFQSKEAETYSYKLTTLYTG